MRLFLCLTLISVATTRENDWQPILPDASLNYDTVVNAQQKSLDPGQLRIVNRRPTNHFRPYTLGIGDKLNNVYHVVPSPSDSCSVYKVSMNQELFYQYLEYEKDMPDLKEFTLCMWTKFHNHSGDHPIFSYADSPKEISVWISNTEQASYFSMAVHGQTFYRLNYPLKLNKWYHTCTSWNGKTGEWQIWVNAERVGRGFHNRLVGHVIKGGGLAISGQEQSLLYNKDGIEPNLRQPGLMGELTMLQMYHVALTAGKAHKDHKHHHAHHFKHDGTPMDPSTEAPTEMPQPGPTPLGNGNFLVGGQLQRPSNLNLAGAQQQQVIPVKLSNGLQFQQSFVNGQLGSHIVSEQLLNNVQQQQLIQGIPVTQLLTGQVPNLANQHMYTLRQSDSPPKTTFVLSGSLLNPANVQFIDDSATYSIYKRDSNTRDKRDNPEKELKIESSGKKDKRGLVALSDGSIVDDALLSLTLNGNSEEEDDIVFQQSLRHGLAGFVGNLPVQNEQKEKSDEREPAEAEVKAVMQVCSGCSPEPFKKALVLSWRTTAKKLYSGAHYYKGLPICRAF